MKFRDSIRILLEENPDGLTPQALRDLIKVRFPELYGTESHIRNVEKGHYKDVEHAVLAQIYIVQNNASDIYSDRSQKPMKLTLLSQSIDETSDVEDVLATEDLEKLESGVGTLYVLGTNLFTSEGEEIIKIGITTGSVERRINQLFNTSVPYKFRVIKKFETGNYSELEQAMHKFFDPYRINRSREFFTSKCLLYIDTLLKMHDEIQKNA